MVCLYLLALYVGDLKGTVTADDLATRLRDLAQLPRLVGSVLADSPRVEQLADRFLKAKHFLYLGRGDSYPIALEGALKLKEIPVIHAPSTRQHAFHKAADPSRERIGDFEHQDSAGFQNARQLCQWLCNRLEMGQNMDRNGRVERAALEWKRK